MGASLTRIDRHYGHPARDGREHAIRLLDTLNAPSEEAIFAPVDVRGRSVDVERAAPRPSRQQNRPWAGDKQKPSDGLEPSTPFLPCS